MRCFPEALIDRFLDETETVDVDAVKPSVQAQAGGSLYLGRWDRKVGEGQAEESARFGEEPGALAWVTR